MSTVVFYQRREDLAAVGMGDEMVMMDLDSGAYFGLNGSAGLLWEALATPQSVDSLSQLLLAHYQVDAVTSLRDATAFLAQLADKGLIRPCT